jgi:hypothetical protein
MEAPLHDYAPVGPPPLPHLTEVDAIYDIVMNMVEVTAGRSAIAMPSNR